MSKAIGPRIARACYGLSALSLLLADGTAFAQTAPEAPATQDVSATTQPSIKLLRVIAALPAGAPWLRLRSSGTGLIPICIYQGTTQTWTGGRAEQALSPYAVAFKKELESASYRVVTPGEDNLFDPESASSDYQAAAVITDEHIDGCVSGGNLFSSRGDISGDSTMKIDWQIYSPIKRQVVAHISTSAAANLDQRVPGGVARLTIEAFAANVRELSANTDFRSAMNTAVSLTKELVTPGQQNRIVLAGSRRRRPSKFQMPRGAW